MKYEVHEAANAFPMLSDAELKELANDIKENGQQMPILLYNGEIIDGRNRSAACKIAGVEPKYENVSCEDPYLYVWSLNAKRRHLTSQEQKALIWLKLYGQSQAMVQERERIKEEASKKMSEAKKGNDNAKKKENKTCTDCTPVVSESQRKPTREAEAKAADVNRGAMARAKALLAADPDLAEEVIKSEKIFSKAKRESDQKLREEARKNVVIKEPKKKEDKKYEVVLADPPWRYDFSETKARDIENHYETATSRDICGHSPQTAKDAILFMWATAPKLKEAFDVMEAWGFTYKTQAVWDKEIIGMGYWFRGQHEILMVGTKGNPKATNEADRVSSVFREKRTRHSKKPQCVYEWIEKAFFDKTKLEMYCREPRNGWDVWGNEV